MANTEAENKAAIESIAADLDTFKAHEIEQDATIQALNDRLNAGQVLTDEDAAELQALADKSKAFVATLNGPSPTEG